MNIKPCATFAGGRCATGYAHKPAAGRTVPLRFLAIPLFLLAIPLISGWMRGHPRDHRYVWIAFGLAPFVLSVGNLDAAIISWSGWPGYTKGLLVSLFDAVAIAVLLATRDRHAPTPFKWLIIVYIAAVALSVPGAFQPTAAIFYVWQLCRVLLVFMAASRIGAQVDGPRYVLMGVAIGAIVQAAVAVNERLHGVVQASGTMGHQNLLGMAMHFALYPLFALFRARPRPGRAQLGFAAALVAVVVRGARATIGLAGFGVVLLLILSLIRRSTGRKVGIAFAGVAALVVAAPVAYASIEHRMTANALASSDDERKAFERAAKMMLADRPLGIGANNYVIVANIGGYSARAGVVASFGSRAANVHNTYLLVAAETGYLGILTFMALMFVPIVAALRYSWAVRRDPRGELALGFAVTLICVAIHCKYEWIFVTVEIQYLFGITLGLTAALLRLRHLEGRDDRIRRRRDRAQAAEIGEPALA